MIEEPVIALPYTLFYTDPVILTPAPRQNYQRVTETGKMLRDALVYGSFNYLDLEVKSGDNSTAYLLRTLGTPLTLGERVTLVEQTRSQQQFLLETMFTEAEQIELTGQKGLTQKDLTKILAYREIIPATPEQLESFIFKRVLGKREISVTLERRVFDPAALDLEDFSRALNRSIGYFEFVYKDLSKPLVDSMREYLACITPVLSPAILEAVQTEPAYLDKAQSNSGADSPAAGNGYVADGSGSGEEAADEEDIATPVPLLNGRFQVASESAAEQAEVALEQALSKGAGSTFTGMPMIDLKGLKPRI